MAQAWVKKDEEVGLSQQSRGLWVVVEQSMPEGHVVHFRHLFLRLRLRLWLCWWCSGDPSRFHILLVLFMLLSFFHL